MSRSFSIGSRTFGVVSLLLELTITVFNFSSINGCQLFLNISGSINCLDLTSVEFRPGKQNASADALSRREETLYVYALSALHLATMPDCVALCDQVTTGTTGADWSFVDGLVLHKGRILVPSSVL